jgi:hypothetical protein
MRKRSKYRPKPRLLDPVAYVIEGMRPAAKHESYLLDLKIKNSGAMAALFRGQAERTDIGALMAMVNMTSALQRMGHGREYGQILAAGHVAMEAVAKRFSREGRVTLYPAEIPPLQDLLELHEAQMEIVAVREVERAIELVKKEVDAGRAVAVDRVEAA